ncbi:MAG TPA: aminotransferase class I/II-fold pyridoxal phosphate-dependent enzyme [Negativicutes bacterium]|nr:aminotransferase class I/II-fold pyridoxal phosphate-dependent enzyme [Negativicutes bacterium]
MQDMLMAASHATGKVATDKIFGANQLAVEAMQKHGRDKITNATIGAILDDNEALVVLPTVDKMFRSLPAAELAGYAPITGLPDYKEAVIGLAFGNSRPEGYVNAIATPGGSGAIRNTIWTYSEVGDTVLTTDWFWGPYQTMCEESLRKLAVFNTFTPEGGFDIGSLAAKGAELLTKQRSLVLLLNTPAHNPTGFSLSREEWKKTVDLLVDFAADKSKRITLFVDVAYLDYAGEKETTREFMGLFSGLPENLLVVIGFSASKGYTMYGVRTGAMIAVTASKAVANEFVNTNELACRSTWSNCPRSGQKILASIYGDKDLRAQVEAEREQWRLTIEQRAKIFMQEAREAGLATLPYKAGFFISLPTTAADTVVAKLNEQNLFAVALAKGVRLAICAIPGQKVPGMAAKIAAAMK